VWGFISDHGELAKKIGIPESHRLVLTDSKWKGARKGRDTDVSYFDEIDESGAVISSYVVEESMSTYPPFKTSVTWQKA